MIRESDKCPDATFHGFVMTQEDGSQRYGVEANMSQSEIEYAESLNEKIRIERKKNGNGKSKNFITETHKQ
ncbi:unnamed protein product [Rhizophagus irregularis]|nr:unnamed protein product [Rhizophagus irregularis]